MLRLIIGGVTLAAVGYAMKEYCEDEGCPWDEPSYTPSTNISTQIEENKVMEKNELANKFHKLKKQYYKNSMKKYKAYLELNEIIDESIYTDQKLKKEDFSNAMIDSEVENFIERIRDTIEILSNNLDLKLHVFEVEKEISEYDKNSMKLYAQNIYKLSHLKLFTTLKDINKEEILSSLVEAMPLVMKKESIFVDLSSE